MTLQQQAQEDAKQDMCTGCISNCNSEHWQARCVGCKDFSNYTAEFPDLPRSCGCHGCLFEAMSNTFPRCVACSMLPASQDLFCPDNITASFSPSAANNQEFDPNGINQHAPGAKLDAGKNRLGLVLKGFAHALWAVGEVGTYGANKYTDSGWQEVPNGQDRYEDAELRHILKRWMGETTDGDSKKLHLAHQAWNALAELELYLREEKKNASKD